MVKRTREEIIMSMCYTYRHDFGLIKQPGLMYTAGVTEKEREYIHTLMSQIYDNDIAPYVTLN